LDQNTVKFRKNWKIQEKLGPKALETDVPSQRSGEVHQQLLAWRCNRKTSEVKNAIEWRI
jgi:hypothetical protein